MKLGIRPLNIFSLLLFLLPLTASGQQEQVQHVRIIATSDVHGNYLPFDFINRLPSGGSLSRVATYVNRVRSAQGAENVLLLDNGDILQGQPTAYFYNFIDTTSTHLCAEALNFLHYDAQTIGNHDVEAGHAVYDRWARQCSAPILAANVIDSITGHPYFRPFTIVNRGGLRIAILGLVTPAIPQWLPKNLWSGIYFSDMVAAARRWVPVLRYKAKADIIVGLFHSGTGSMDAAYTRRQENAALQVARMVPGFDLVVCGHDHREASLRIENVRGDTVVVLNPGSGCMAVAEADIAATRHADGTLVKRTQGRIVSIADEAPDTAFVGQFAGQWNAVTDFVDERIGSCASDLSTRPAFFGPSPFVDLIHTMQLRIAHADISFCAPLSFDATIAKGDIHVADMFKLYKYENQLYAMLLSGREIKRYLEYSYALWTAQMTDATDHMILFRSDALQIDVPWQRLVNASYNFDSAAGLRYTVDLRRPAGDRITIESLSDGRPFSPDSTYRVAVNSYRGGGGGNLLTKGAGIAKEDLPARIVWSTDKDLRYYLMQDIRRQGTIHPKARNEWRFIPEAWIEQAARRDSILLFGE